MPSRKRKVEKLKEGSNSQRVEQGSSQGGARGSNSYQGCSEEEVGRLNSGLDGWMVDGWWMTRMKTITIKMQ